MDMQVSSKFQLRLSKFTSKSPFMTGGIGVQELGVNPDMIQATYRYERNMVQQLILALESISMKISKPQNVCYENQIVFTSQNDRLRPIDRNGLEMSFTPVQGKGKRKTQKMREPWLGVSTIFFFKQLSVIPYSNATRCR